MSIRRKIILNALLLAAAIVLGRFLSIRTAIVSIDFYFVPIVLAAIILGWKSALFVATFADLIGALLFPTGSFFPGFTLTAALTGLIFGLFLQQKSLADFQITRQFIIRLVIATMLVVILLNGVLNTVWIYIISGGASTVILPVRILKQLILAPVIIVTTLALSRALQPVFRKLAAEESIDDSRE